MPAMMVRQQDAEGDPPIQNLKNQSTINPSHQSRRNHPASWPVSYAAEPDGDGSALRGLRGL
jgi:hypothetical protein